MTIVLTSGRYVGMKPCISRLPENGYGANITAWPARLNDLPERLQSIEMDAYISRKEIFKADSKFWREVVGSYVHAYHWEDLNLRNVMDMRAGFGGYFLYIPFAYLLLYCKDSGICKVFSIFGIIL